MANVLYDDLQSKQSNPLNNFISTVKEAQKTFKGSPKETVQHLLNSGAMSQQQFNQFAQMANQIMPFMGRY